MAEEISADVCYRHPKRESWTLCGRCGRTICPECQILTPNGVRCPDCVQETGGSVTWTSTAPARKPAPKRRARPERVSTSGGGAVGGYGQMFRPGGETPTVTWGIGAAALALWVVGIFWTLPLEILSTFGGEPWQIWRFFTGALIYPPVWQFLLSLLLNALFLALIAPTVEVRLGRRRFVLLALAGAAVGNATMALAGGFGFGLTGVLYAAFGAYLILMWAYPMARIQILIIIGINVLLSLAFASVLLPQLFGGLIAGVGGMLAFQRDDNAGGSTRRAPVLIGLGTGVFIVLAILRSYAG